jgi:adenosylhomocysteine nucleosidase
MKIVVLISANAEWRSIKQIFPDAVLQQSPFGETFHLTLDTWNLTLFHGGWGKVSAAATAQYVIDHHQPDAIINLGTCGGFEGRIERGTIILVTKTLVYDIIEQMSDGAEEIAHYTTEIDLSWLNVDGLSFVVRGLMISGDRDIMVEDIPMLIEKYDAVAADWESAAIAWVCHRNQTRCLILRGVSDLVGAGGGEAYGNIDLFQKRTHEIMSALIDQLPMWLKRIKVS